MQFFELPLSHELAAGLLLLHLLVHSCQILFSFSDNCLCSPYFQLLIDYLYLALEPLIGVQTPFLSLVGLGRKLKFYNYLIHSFGQLILTVIA